MTNYIFDVSGSILIIFSCSAFFFCLQESSSNLLTHMKKEFRCKLTSVQHAHFTGKHLPSLESVALWSVETHGLQNLKSGLDILKTDFRMCLMPWAIQVTFLNRFPCGKPSKFWLLKKLDNFWQT